MNRQEGAKPESARDGKPIWLSVAKTCFRIVVIALVAWGLTRFARNALRDLERQEFSLRQVQSYWLVLAGATYVVGMVPSWIFWHRTLVALRQRPKWGASLRAFFIGHLGKYVPGKALVVVIRARLASGPDVNATVAATCVFVETLTTMAVGAAVSAAILSFYSEHWWLTLIAIGLMLGAGLPTIPPVFRRLVGWLGVRRAHGDIVRLLEGLDYRLMASGWLMISLSWLFFGFSLMATLKSIPGVPEIGPSELPLLTACVALAVVAGFLSLIPGGAGVRELVVTSLLAPRFGAVVAIGGAVLLRLVWLVSELVVSSILYWTPTRR